MWYSLLKNTHKSSWWWLYIAGFMSVFHLILFFLLFFIYCDGVSHLALVITPDLMRRDIEFRIAVETIKKPKVASVKAEVVQKKGAPATQVQKTKQTKKQVTVAQKKEPIAPKKEVIAQKKPAPKVEVPKPVSTAAPVATPPVAAQEPEHIDMQIMANKDMKGFEQEYIALYQDIAALWSPPPGVPAASICTITIAIDRQGLVTAMDVDTSSGMLVYDLAAQAALSELKFPRVAWGKSITITFTV